MNDTTEFLTTGQAARLMGASRQHVVVLCDKGKLASFRVGSHRRVRAADVERLKQDSSGIDSSHLFTLWLNRAIVAYIVKDPISTLELGAREIDAQWEGNAAAHRWLDDWRHVISRGSEAVMRVLTATDPESLSMQNMSPFKRLLPLDERNQIADAFEVYLAASASPS
jgi:excisionase family DNA binding protein